MDINNVATIGTTLASVSANQGTTISQQSVSTKSPAKDSLQISDVVEISDAGKSALKNAQAQPAVGAPAPKAPTADAGGKTANTANSLEELGLTASTDGTSESSSITSDSELSTLSETELKDLLSQGKITQQQLDSEMSRRSGTDTEQSATQSRGAAAQQAAQSYRQTVEEYKAQSSPAEKTARSASIDFAA